jgi:integrase
MMKANIYTTTDGQWQDAIKAEKKLGRLLKYIENSWSLMASSIAAFTEHRLKVKLYQEEKNERPFLDHEQIDIFVAAVKGLPFEIPALLCLSSLRRSELIALKWKNVDLKKKVIYVQGARVRGEDGLVEKKQNKSKKSRRAVPIIPPLLEALQNADRKTEYVCTMTGDLTLTRVNKICAANGLPEVGLHGLRHSFASLAYHLGIPEMIAAEIGGWDDLATMHNIYTHLAERDIAKRSQEFSDYFDLEKRKKKAESGDEGGDKK